jgi:hypothetical protein
MEIEGVNDPIVDLSIKIPKKYNQNQYNKNFQIKNKDRINKKYDCNICFGSYTYFNKSKHNQSLRHRKALMIKEDKDALNDPKYIFQKAFPIDTADY